MPQLLSKSSHASTMDPRATGPLHVMRHAPQVEMRSATTATATATTMATNHNDTNSRDLGLMTPRQDAMCAPYSPWQTKLLSPIWCDSVSPSSQMEGADTVGVYALSPSSSIGSAARVHLQSPQQQQLPLHHATLAITAAAHHTRVPSFHWTPPRATLMQTRAAPPQVASVPHAAPSAPAGLHTIGSLDHATPASPAARPTSPHTPRRQFIPAHPCPAPPPSSFAYLGNTAGAMPPTWSSPDARRASGNSCQHAMSPPLRPPPAWSPPTHTHRGGRGGTLECLREPSLPLPPPLAHFSMPLESMRGAAAGGNASGPSLSVPHSDMCDATVEDEAPSRRRGQCALSSSTIQTSLVLGPRQSSIGNGDGASHSNNSTTAGNDKVSVSTTTTTTTATNTCFSASTRQHAAMAARSPLTRLLASPQMCWTPPQQLRGRGAPQRGADTGAGGAAMCTPVRVVLAQNEAHSTPTAAPTAALSDMARTPLAGVFTPVTTLMVPPPVLTPHTQHTPQRAFYSSSQPHADREEEDDEEEEEEYAMAIDEDGSILSNKDVRRRPTHSYGAAYSPDLAPYTAATSAAASAAPLAGSSPCFSSPFVPFRTPAAVARPLFKLEAGEEEEYEEAAESMSAWQGVSHMNDARMPPTFLAHVGISLEGEERERVHEMEARDTSAVASPRSASEDAASRADLVSAAQWLDLLLLFRDRENEKPSSRVMPCLSAFESATASFNDGEAPRSPPPPPFVDVAHRSHTTTMTAVQHLPHRVSHSSGHARDGQAEEIEHAAFRHVCQRRAAREQRVVEALDADTFPHPLLRVR